MLTSMSLWDAVAGLEVRVDDYALQRRESKTPSGWTRVTTTVVLQGDGVAGEGEDVTYSADDHEHVPDELMLAGTWTVEDFSRRLDELELWPSDSDNSAGQDHRRWAFESAMLDLALRQNELGLGEAFGREERPVRFLVSTRAAPERWLEVAPELEFKLDAETDWDRALLQRLRALDRVRVVDLKAYYRGTSVDLAPAPDLYRAIAEELPDAIIEDAWLEDGCREALAGAEDRLSFDAPVHSLADLDALPLEPRWLNIKPSRFGTVRELLETIEACEERGVRLYGGGQYELGPGRLQIQRLASVFYPDEPNDVAPSAYNEGEPRPDLPQSPLPAPEGPGLS
jgi:L-alanine-DL-glutamate epimerase-like enolase superfamily enzyme